MSEMPFAHPGSIDNSVALYYLRSLALFYNTDDTSEGLFSFLPPVSTIPRCNSSPRSGCTATGITLTATPLAPRSRMSFRASPSPTGTMSSTPHLLGSFTSGGSLVGKSHPPKRLVLDRSRNQAKASRPAHRPENGKEDGASPSKSEPRLSPVSARSERRSGANERARRFTACAPGTTPFCS